MNYKFLQPYTFANGITVKNRIVIPAMTIRYSLHNGEVSLNDMNFANIHTGGVGMYMTPTAFVSENGRGYLGQPSVANDNMIDGLAGLAQAMKKKGTKAILQIFHAGRESNHNLINAAGLDSLGTYFTDNTTDLRPVAPSAIADTARHGETPRALTEEEIEKLIDDFRQATRRAIQAGFDGVEIHGANNYLLQQFFSPESNKRTDEWGGSLENRMRFPLAVINSVYEAVKKYADRPFIIGYRISPEENGKNGIQLSDTLKFVKRLADSPIDYLHVSMGKLWRKSLNNPNEKTPTNVLIKNTLDGKKPMIVVGSVSKPDEVEKAMDAGFDFVAMGREALREPKWVQKVIDNDENSIRYDFDASEKEEFGVNNDLFNILKLMGFNIKGGNSDSNLIALNK